VQTLLGTQPVPRSYFEPFKEAPPSCTQFPYEGENINAAYRVVETTWCAAQERERERERESVARVERDSLGTHGEVVPEQTNLMCLPG